MEMRKIGPQLMKYLFIIETPDICVQCKGKTNLRRNLLENSVKSSFGYLQAIMLSHSLTYLIWAK